MLMKKRQIIIVALSVMIVIAAYLNWAYTGVGDGSVQTAGAIADQTRTYGEAEFVNSQTNGEPKGSPNPSASPAAKPAAGSSAGVFSEARMNRDKARGDALDILQEIVDNNNSLKEDVSKAQDKMSVIADRVAKESSMENQIKAKGFADAVVFITDDNVSVSVASDALVPSDTAKILDIVMSETKMTADKIKIIPIK